MTDQKAGAIALVAGSLASIVLMVMHPTHISGQIVGAISVNGLVHGTALIAAPVLAYGAFIFSREFGAGRPLAWIAFALYVLAGAMIMNAATMSGLVLPQVMPLDADPLVTLTRAINQGYAHVYTGLTALALILWSIAWPARSLAGQAFRVWGLIVGLGLIYWQLFAGLTLNVHGMAAVTFLIASWTVPAGLALFSAKPTA